MEKLWSTPHIHDGSWLLGGRRQPTVGASRRCVFEQMEPRQMLAADVAIGAAVGSEAPSFGFTGGATGSITGSVVATPSINNCTDHDSAVGLTAIRVQLLDETGRVVEETTTDGHGEYLFADLIPGQYAVRRIAEAGQLEGAAHVGAGGGLILGLNQVGEIDVQGGEALTDYDFCQFEVSPEVAGPVDPRIVPHSGIDEVNGGAVQIQLASLLAITAQEIPAEAPLVTLESTVRSGSQQIVSVVEQPAVNAVQSFVSYGGSSQELKSPRPIELWDESPVDSWSLDDLFSTLSFYEPAGLVPMSAVSLDAILEGAAVHDDVAFADGYTTNSLEWCKSCTKVELQELLGDAEGIVLDSEQADEDTAEQKFIARLPDTKSTK